MFYLLGFGSGCVYAVCRRFNGGWLIPSWGHLLKIIIPALFGLGAGYVADGWIYGLVFSVGLPFTSLNKWHSKGQGMGFVPPPNLLKSILWMAGSYTGYCLIVGAALSVVLHSAFGLLYAVSGLLTPVGYNLGRFLVPRVLGALNKSGQYSNPVKVFGQNFIATYTDVGELGIGFVLGAGAFIPVIVMGYFQETFWQKVMDAVSSVIPVLLTLMK